MHEVTLSTSALNSGLVDMFYLKFLPTDYFYARMNATFSDFHVCVQLIFLNYKILFTSFFMRTKKR